MANLKSITPFVPVTDMEKSVDFYQRVLGFKARIKTEFYSYVERDSIALRLIRAGADKDMSHPDSQVHCYVDVSDLDNLYAELEPELTKLPQGRVRAPFDTDYGQREFHVIDPDVLLISFGEPIA